MKRGLLAATVAGLGIPVLTEPVEAGLGQDLIAHYHLNNLKGRGRNKDEVHDSSPNRNDGTAKGDVSVTDGRVGRAYKFDGDGDYVTIPDDPTFSPTAANEITLSAWIRADSSQPDNASGIVTKDDLNDDREWNLHLSSTSSPTPWALRCRVPPLEGQDLVDGTTALRDDQWHHVVGRWDGSELSVWVDAVKENFVTPTGEMVDHDADVRIGNFADGSYEFDGDIDDVYVFGRALSDDEICQLFMRGAGDGLVAHYPLDGFDDTDVVPDESGEDNDGTANGDPTFVSGQVDDALSFDGVDDEVLVPDAPELRPGSSSWSIAFWANPEDAPQNTAVVSKRQPSSPVPMYLIGFASDSSFVNDGRKLTFRYTEIARDTDRGVHTDVDVVAGDWHHFVGVADKSDDELRLFVDGSMAATTTDFDDGVSWPTITNDDDLYLGQDNGGGRRYSGLLDDVRIYNRALTASEINGIYHCQSD